MDYINSRIDISIHSSHTGRDRLVEYTYHNKRISIHSSHTGRDLRWMVPLSLKSAFQSTLPIREETAIAAVFGNWQSISIHSSHTGRDGPVLSLYPCPGHFNPLFPYGKRRGGADQAGQPSNFNPLFPYGKRQQARAGPKTGKNFNPLFPYGKRRAGT